MCDSLGPCDLERRNKTATQTADNVGTKAHPLTCVDRRLRGRPARLRDSRWSQEQNCDVGDPKSNPRLGRS